MRRFGLIGHPLGHSFSKKFFTEKFAAEGIEDCVYDLFPIPGIEALPQLLRDHPDLEGLNVTIPYKQQVIPFLHDSSGLGLDACNCIRIRNGKLEGFNTDVVGFEKSLLPLLEDRRPPALVLGNGGAALAVCQVLRQLQLPFEVVSRQLHQGSTLTYQDLDEELIQRYPLIINTTPLGTYPQVDGCPPLPYEALSKEHILYDLVYNPEKTKFLELGEKRGARIRNGYSMLVIQAEESWRIWNR